MPGQDLSIADRVRELRQRRGLTQDELAEKAGLSVKVVGKIEQGGTGRIETYHAIARALGVRTVWFMTPETPDPAPDRGTSPALAAIRAVVNPPAGLRGPRFTIDSDIPPDLSLLRRAVTGVARAYQADRYDDVAQMAPAVIRSATAHVTALDGNDQEEARRLRADALQLTGRYLIQIREHDLAVIALKGSLEDALAVGDMPLTATAIGQQAWALVRQARFDEVEALCVATADEIEPTRLSQASRDDLASWGHLLSWGATAAARNNRPDEAREMQSLAATAAARIGVDYEGPGYRHFGPATIALAQLQNELVTGRPDRALELAETLPDLTGVAPTTRRRHQIDQAKAHVLTGDGERATEILHGLRLEAPQWLRQQQYAREVTEDVLAGPMKPTRQQRELADFLGVLV